jgi:hypothetical protein
MTIIEFDNNHTITNIEKYFCILLGHEENCLIGKNISTIINSEQLELITHAINTKHYVEGIFSFSKKDSNKLKISGVFFKKSKTDKTEFKVRQSKLKSEITTQGYDGAQIEEISSFQSQIQKLLAENKERLKELAAINQTTSILREGKKIEEALQQIVLILPKAWQYPDSAIARIQYKGKEYKSSNYISTPWKIIQKFETNEASDGEIEIAYTEEFPLKDEGPFVKEERYLINNVALLIAGYTNSNKPLQQKDENINTAEKEIDLTKTEYNQILNQFLNKHKSDRDIYHDLMPFKVKEILLITTLFDAYCIENEGKFTDHILGEYQQLNLTSLPRITGISNIDDALKLLRKKHFDLIIMMSGLNKDLPIQMSKLIKNEFPYIPIYLLINNNIVGAENIKLEYTNRYIDRIFIWNSDSKIFFAMVKLLEDKINLDNDTAKGMVRIILYVDNSPESYSKNIPMLYQIILEQAKKLIEEVGTDELYKVLKLRSRPKIIITSDYIEATDIINKYKDYMLCMITDIDLNKNGSLNALAGKELITFIRSHIKEIPVVIHSEKQKNKEIAKELNTSFIDKNSISLKNDFKCFITDYLGFGKFIFKDSVGNPMAIANTIQEFEAHLKTLPVDSLIFHAMNNHFSLWLMARGEIRIAKTIHPKKVSDFSKANDLRNYILKVIHQNLIQNKMGKLIDFEEISINDSSNILSLSEGTIGEKARSILFINHFLYNYDISKMINGINIKAPLSFVIGANEFQHFISKNKLFEISSQNMEDKKLQDEFLKGSLSDELILKLKKILSLISKPLVVRSSDVNENNYSGFYKTIFIPNNATDIDTRLNELLKAIKLVYASVFSNEVKKLNAKFSSELQRNQMAIIIQEVVGNQYEKMFYPHISGVAQSVNIYPFKQMKPEDGIVSLAFGLGKQISDGKKCYRFSPKNPELEYRPIKELIYHSQDEFFALDLTPPHTNKIEDYLKSYSMDEAYKQGTLEYCASTYNPHKEIIEPGLSSIGTVITNFSDILTYNYIPLAKTIDYLLNMFSEIYGVAVEIEFALDLNKDDTNKASLYLLQIKPQNITKWDEQEVVNHSPILVSSSYSLGNGIISNIKDIVFIDPESFDKNNTKVIAYEIDEINSKLLKENKEYILIGPGRWGSKDKHLGIPVTWTQISNAKVIIEHSRNDFPLNLSQGAHFFNNIVSKKMGYLAIPKFDSKNIIDWELMHKFEIINQTKHVKHVRSYNNLNIKMNGKNQTAILY